MRRLAIGAVLGLAPALLAWTARADTALKGDVDNGATLFRVQCAACHGVDGRGGGDLTSKLPGPVGNLRDPAMLATRSNDDLKSEILKGVPSAKPPMLMPGSPWLNGLELEDLITFLRHDALNVTDFFPTAKYFIAKNYTFDKKALARIQKLSGQSVGPGENTMTVVTFYGDDTPKGPEFVPQDPVQLDKLSPKDRKGYVVFVDLPQGKGRVTTGMAVGRDGDVLAVHTQAGLRTPALDKDYQGYVGQGNKVDPSAIPAARRARPAPRLLKPTPSTWPTPAPWKASAAADADEEGPALGRHELDILPRSLPFLTAALTGFGRGDQDLARRLRRRGAAGCGSVRRRRAPLSVGREARPRHTGGGARPGASVLGRASRRRLRRAQGSSGGGAPVVLRSPRIWHPPKLEIPGARVLATSRHGHKLRSGALRGNRFWVRLRGARDRAALEPLLGLLVSAGVPNWFGPQRFGRRSDNAVLGAALIGIGTHPLGAKAQRDRFLRKLSLSALQSELFNRLLAARVGEGRLGELEAGDVVLVPEDQRPFVARDDALAARVAAFDAAVTGPMFGSRMLPAEGVPGARELQTLEEAGLHLDDFARGEGELRGTRRPYRFKLAGVDLRVDDEGLMLVFDLPAGGYATSILRELTRDAATLAPEGEA